MACPRCGARIPTLAANCPKCGAPAPEASLGDRVTRGAPRGGPGIVGALAAGTVVARRYTIETPLGHGGMGVVYKARDARPSRPVALKFLALDDADDQVGLTRFLQEAEVIARLSHQNIIQVYEVGEWNHAEGTAHFIAMEFVEGGTLRETLRQRGALPVPEACDLMRDVGHALAHAHRQGVIHRDLKPANVLLTSEGVPKLADFGLAKAASESELSRAGHGMGTLGFMSPEQRHDAKNVDHRTDIYAWGATFYQVVTGKDPLAWDPEEIPEALAKLIRRCLKDREGRYFSMDEALAALDAAVRPTPVAAPEVPSPNAAGTCPKCGAECEPGIRFCQNCGAPQGRKCPACGKELKSDAKFCGSCGADIARASAITPPSSPAADAQLEMIPDLAPPSRQRTATRETPPEGSDVGTSSQDDDEDRDALFEDVRRGLRRGSEGTAAPDRRRRETPLPRRASPAPNVKSYLALAIVSTLCCWPLGIPAIVFAARANSRAAAGDYEAGAEASARARRWSTAALAIGIALQFLYIVGMVMAASSRSRW